MPESDWETIQTKKGQDIGNVTEDQKNATIEKAERTWDKMGLTDEQKAFGIATMGLESGFDPNAKSSAKGSDEHGLGQFKRETWGDGTVTMRGRDGQLIYWALGWGVTIAEEPYLKDIVPGSWDEMLKEETAWLKNKGWL